MKKRYAALLLCTFGILSGCEKFLDVNDNPNGPQSVSANLYLPPMLHWMVTTPFYDGRYIGRYTQEWMLGGTSLSNYDRMGYDDASDAGGEQWKAAYWELGQNLIDMNTKAEAEQRWDLLGVGEILKAWGWEATTDLHGEIIIKEAFEPGRFSFDYDPQSLAYSEVQRLLRDAITNLKRTDGAVDQTYLARGDHIYNGDRTKWLKFAYGMLAINANHYTDRPSQYDPAKVIAWVDSSFTSNADDALLTYPNTNNDDINFLGRTRGNFNAYRQTQFGVWLMDGTDFGVVDPRLTRMLSPSPDSVWRGLDINIPNYNNLPATQIPMNFYGYAGSGGVGLPGRYFFDDKAKMPAMTYSELQFVKAEAAYLMGDKATALDAYTKGVSSHLDFVNARNSDDNQTPPQITAAEKAAFLASPAIIPTDPNSLTLTQIMSQKWIALWGWGHDEMWMDMRRYHYTDLDPVTGEQIYPNFEIPKSLTANNAGKPVQRLRPRYNSEYVWNLPALTAIGADKPEWITKPLWIIDPSQP